MRTTITIGLAALLLAFGSAPVGAETTGKETLSEARKGFETKLTRSDREHESLGEPNESLFSLVSVPTPIGDMAAYLSKPTADGQKQPAILWITGGFPPSGIGPSAWEPAPSDNDQSAKAYRLAGTVMMYPTVRGSFGNPGAQEYFYGEVDDIVAAAEYLAKVEYVDPDRIYLGGHSTGGTLALLVAEVSDRFAGVISFGPVEDPIGYGDEVPFDPENKQEVRLRAPIHWLAGIKSPTWVIEGSGRGNADSVEAMRKASKNDALTFIIVEGATHFDILAPVNDLIAHKIAALADGGGLELSQREAQSAFDDHMRAQREAEDLETLATIRRDGIDITERHLVEHYLVSREPDGLEKARADVEKKKFEASEVAKRTDRGGRIYYLVRATKKLALSDLDTVFGASKAMAEIAAEHGIQYDGWYLE